MNYIPEDNKKALKEFKYDGGTDSILYQHLWSPFAEFLLQYIPIWIAPNLITFTGLLILIISHLIFMLADDQDIIPGWKLVMMAVTIFTYQHLDNIDGKQARKTKSSTPLGMLFDHGADAISSFLISSQILKIIGLSYSLRIFVLYAFVMSVYFCAMWSQYAVGYFKLGRVNPVDEGIPGYALFCLIATQMDLSILKKMHRIGTYGQQVVYFLFIIVIFQIVYMTKDIFKSAIRPLKEFIFIPMLYVITGLALYGLYTTVNKIDQYVYYPFLYALIPMWAGNMILMQLSFVIKTQYKIFNRGTNIFLGMTGIYILLHDKLSLSDFQFFTLMATTQTLIFLEFCISVIRQSSQILKVRVFSLKLVHKNN